MGPGGTMEHAVIEDETIMDRREYHTINEVKNGLGPAPLKTARAGCTWLMECATPRRAALRALLFSVASWTHPGR